jgi:hypothetical protein
MTSLASKLLLTLAFASCVAPLACSSSSSGLTCGAGTVQQGSQCVASYEAGAEAGADAVAEAEGAAPEDDSSADAYPGPTFAGVAAVAPVSPTELLATWAAGNDAEDGPGSLRYRVFVGTSDKALSYAAPSVVTAAGALSTVIGGLQANTKYVVGVRAVDEDGVDDGNLVTRMATTGHDSIPPVFAGLTAAAPGDGGAVDLSWAAATDDMTPAAAIAYLVYESDAVAGEDFTAPVAVTAPGETSTTVTGLPNAGKTRYFVVRARDAAGNVDTNAVEKSSKPGPDKTAPHFAGCAAATRVSALSIAVSWSPADDDVSAPANLAYDVYAATEGGAFDFTRPFAVVKGQDAAVVQALKPGTRYSFICRAKDEAGNEDANTAEVSATTGANPVPPTFAGIATLTGDPVARTATITWLPGMDLVTPQDQLVYDVFVAQAAGAEAFDKPPFITSAPGATSIDVSGLPPNTTLFFVVRARDGDENEDDNTVEKSMATNASFSLNVQPIFTHDCGVVGCHVPGNPTGGLILAPGFAYGALVGVPALEMAGLAIDGGTVAYVSPGDPGDSFLSIKIDANLLAAVKAGQPPAVAPKLGTLMPAPSTGSTLTQAELATITSWIAQGAPNN